MMTNIGKLRNPVPIVALAAALMITGCEPGDRRAETDRDEGEYRQSEIAGRGEIPPGTPDPTWTDPAQPIEEPAGAAPGDINLQQQIQTSLQQDEQLTAIAQDIEVSAAGGTVTLSGTVSSEQEKQQIEQKVRDLPGVQDVRNQLRVQIQQQQQQEPEGQEPQQQQPQQPQAPPL